MGGYLFPMVAVTVFHFRKCGFKGLIPANSRGRHNSRPRPDMASWSLAGLASMDFFNLAIGSLNGIAHGALL